MELEYFVEPGEDEKWDKIWIDERLKWWEDQGVSKNNIKLLNVEKDELAHYSKATVDLMYKFPHGLEELEGIANRTDFDLGSHSKNQNEFEIKSKTKLNKGSNSKLAVQREDNSWFVPFVIEPSAGVDRGFLAILNEAYKEESLENGSKRVVLALKSHLAPIKAAIVPLKKNNEKLVNLAKKLKKELQNQKLEIILENTGNIGKSYRKHDEIGTPMCITVDFDSLEKETVTVRDRDSMAQQVIPINELTEFYKKFLN